MNRDFKQRIITISGVKNSGKTTLIEKLLKEFCADGLRVAVLKHDGHDFTCDIPGTDTYRFSAAGAYGTAIFSKNRMFVHKIGTEETEKSLIAQFPEADLILLEGFKEKPFPKLEIIRNGNSQQPASNPVGRFLFVTDIPNADFGGETLSLNDPKAIAERILQYAKNGK